MDRILVVLNYIFIIVVGIFLLSMGLLLLEIVTQEKMGEKEVKCYDNEGNEMKGLVCEEEIFCGIVEKGLGFCEVKEK